MLRLSLLLGTIAALADVAGGLVLEAGGEVIGALGVSGAEPSAKDEECGLAGIARIKDRLK